LKCRGIWFAEDLGVRIDLLNTEKLMCWITKALVIATEVSCFHSLDPESRANEIVLDGPCAMSVIFPVEHDHAWK